MESSSSKTGVRWLGVGVAILALLLLSAGSRPARAAAVDPRIEAWVKNLKSVEQDLLHGRHQEALSVSRRVIKQVVAELGPGENAGYLLGVAVLYRAVAEAGLGSEADAVWDWHVAQALHPPFAKTDLSVFGPAGAVLAAHPLRPEVRCTSSSDCDPEPGPGEPRITPPKLLKQTKPVYPPGARDFRVAGALVVQVIIGADGVPSEPRVLRPLGVPTLGYAALECVREWRFEPARREDTPVPVTFNLTVNYRLRD